VTEVVEAQGFKAGAVAGFAEADAQPVVVERCAETVRKDEVVGAGEVLAAAEVVEDLGGAVD